MERDGRIGVLHLFGVLFQVVGCESEFLLISEAVWDLFTETAVSKISRVSRRGEGYSGHGFRVIARMSRLAELVLGSLSGRGFLSIQYQIELSVSPV